MAEEEKKVEEQEKIALEFTPAELFQLHLCVVCRTSDATIKWANACSESEQNHSQKIIQFLTGIEHKIEGKLREYEQQKKQAAK